ncbi:hypothetical protein TYRP_020777 [Tyrophagus putrescentiae]|nr:hypothetical protein TYRP_020777 [Tyrophagus putrescentiae]
MSERNPYVHRRKLNRFHSSVPYARVNDAQNSAANSDPKPQLPRMVVHLAGEAAISKHGLTDLQAITNSSQPPSTPVPLDQLTGRICPVCQLSTPPLTTEKIFAVTECAHMLCYECALRLHFTSSKPSAEGIDCPTCGQPSRQVILTREQFANVDQVKAFAQRWWTSLDTTGPTGQCPTPLVNFDSLVLFEPTFSDDFLPLLDALMNIKCYRCGLDVLRCWGPVRQNWRQFENLSKHFEQHRKDRRTFCRLCFLHLKTLPIEMKLYNIKGSEDIDETYVDHLRYGSVELDGVFIHHPRCTLCFGQLAPGAVPTVDHYFFDQEALFKHANENHAICVGCPEKHTFFRDVKERDEHFVKDH